MVIMMIIDIVNVIVIIIIICKHILFIPFVGLDALKKRIIPYYKPLT